MKRNFSVGSDLSPRWAAPGYRAFSDTPNLNDKFYRGKYPYIVNFFLSIQSSPSKLDLATPTRSILNLGLFEFPLKAVTHLLPAFRE